MRSSPMVKCSVCCGFSQNKYMDNETILCHSWAGTPMTWDFPPKPQVLPPPPPPHTHRPKCLSCFKIRYLFMYVYKHSVITICIHVQQHRNEYVQHHTISEFHQNSPYSYQNLEQILHQVTNILGHTLGNNNLPICYDQ